VTSVRNLNPILSSRNLLIIRANISFKKILYKINKFKKLDVVWVQKANPTQMTTILAARLFGKKFLWIQNFSNPPEPSFFTKLLLNQTDIITVTSKKMAAKLHNFGIDKPKIRIHK
jgi:hypothetical protein